VERISQTDTDTELGNHDYENPLTFATGAPETTEHWSADGGEDD
jgi:hypothetical protein